jgi:enoyl-CoA hydratase
MPYNTLSFDVRDRVATVTVNRPDKLNALNDATIAELGAAFGEVASRDDIAGVIVTGAGTRAFVAGADIAELATQGAFDGRARARLGQMVFARIEQSAKPVIAAVNGFALGGGCELALACHIRIASESAKFALPEVKLGIGPGYGGTQRLPRLIGTGRALEMMLSGRRVKADEAERIGLVNRVVPREQLLAEAEALAASMLKNGPLAVAAVLEAVERGLQLPLDDGLRLESGLFGILAASHDMHEGLNAFLEKRPAKFERR